jgi:ATP-binding cassette, subfamily C, bacterial LapB
MKKFFKKREYYLTDERLRAYFSEKSPYLNALLPLLSALNFKGTEENLIEVAPYLSRYLGVFDFLLMIEKLGFSTVLSEKISPKKLLELKNFPALWITTENEIDEIYVILESKGGDKLSERGFLAFFANDRKIVHLDLSLMGEKTKGKLYEFFPSHAAQHFSGLGLKGKIKSLKNENMGLKGKAQKILGVREFLQRYQGIFAQILFLTSIQSLTFLAIPFYVMGVYSYVIEAGSYSLLAEFLIGILVSVIFVFSLQYIRSRLLSYIGIKLDQEMGNAIVEKILYLPALSSRQIPLSSAISQIKNFDTIREFLTGESMIHLLEAPFLLFFLITLAFLGKWLVFIPLVMGALLFLVILVLRRFFFSRVEQLALAHSDLQEFMFETLSHSHLIQKIGGTKIWIERYRQKLLDKVRATVESNVTQQITSSVSDAIVMISGLMVLAFGVLFVWSNEIPVSSLLAVMILTWRILSPVKSLLLIFIQIKSVKAGILQLDNLLNFPSEVQHPFSASQSLNPFCNPQFDVASNFENSSFLRSSLVFQNVSFRFPQKKENALSNISFEIKPGTLIGLTGLSGSGKSTLLKLILNLYPGFFGEILMGNKNIAQFPLSFLRKNISLASQEPEFFSGTLRENLALRDPLVTDREIEEVLKKVGIWDLVSALPKGVSTLIQGQSMQWPGIQEVLQCLSLARALIRPTPILLLDEVADSFDSELAENFRKLLVTLRGKVTIILVTQSPYYLELADEIFFLQQGALVGKGLSQEMLKKIKELYPEASSNKKSETSNQ